jgi:LETM1 and EF-hand domain-containing protein 1, mitochondrial
MSLWLPRSSSAVSRAHSLSVARRSAALAVGRRPAAAHLPVILLLRPESALQTRHESTKSTGKASASTHALSSSESPSSSEAKSGPPVSPKPPLATRVWEKVKHEAAHYWHGSKLLVREVRISSRLQWKILQGEALTRRERRQVWAPMGRVSPNTNVLHCS